MCDGSFFNSEIFGTVFRSEAIVVGGSPLGGLFKKISDDDAVAVCKAAFDAG